MKIRNGFVSNSSSSSFIIAVKGETIESKIKKMQKKLQSTTGIPLKDIFNQILEAIKQNVDKPKTVDELADYYNYDDAKEFIENHLELEKPIKEKWKIYSSEFGDEDSSPVEEFLCNLEIEIKEKDFIFIKSEGY